MMNEEDIKWLLRRYYSADTVELTARPWVSGDGYEIGATLTILSRPDEVIVSPDPNTPLTPLGRALDAVQRQRQQLQHDGSTPAVPHPMLRDDFDEVQPSVSANCGRPECSSFVYCPHSDGGPAVQPDAAEGEAP